jgi:predicted metalloprotease with PDZ domain
MKRALWLLPLLLLGAAQDRRLSVAYTVFVDKPERGIVSIEMEIKGSSADELRVAIPAWAPGAYRIRDYHKAVSNLRAADGAARARAVERVDDLAWKISADGVDPLYVSYDLSVEPSRLNEEHCLLEGPATFLYVAGTKDAPCRVRFLVPEGWRIATGLDRRGGAYLARDYDTLIDAPTEIGLFELIEFDQDGARYELVIHSKGPVDGQALAGICRRIVKEQNAIFGGPPFDRYVFFYHFGDGFGGGGLEHLNSTTISAPYEQVARDPTVPASVTSHEYFHLWNVKRIRPAELGPFDYTGVVRSKALWFSEGCTSYFGDRTLARAAMWSEERYFRHLAGEIETLQNNPDRRVTSVEKASQSTWDREDWPRVDYYNKGELIGLLVDLRIRTMSEGRLGLDDVMRYLYETYVTGPAREGQGPIGIGFPEDGVLKALNKVTGADWTDFYDRFIRGVEELPYVDILAAAGLAVEIRAEKRPDLGLLLRRTTVASVDAGSAAEGAGVKARDRVVAVDGREVTRGNLRELTEMLRPGGTVRVTLGRGQERIEVELPVVEREVVRCRLARAENPTELQRQVLAGWLGRD